MKVLLQGAIGGYGVATFVTDLAKNLRGLGLDVRIMVSPERAIFFARELHSGDIAPWRLREIAKADVIHISYAFPSIPLMLHPSRSKFAVVYTTHGVPIPSMEPRLEQRIGYDIERASLKWVAKKSSRVVAISAFVRDLLFSQYRVSATVIRNGVDADLFRPPSVGEKIAVKNALGLSSRPVILFVGRIHPAKDPLTFLRCIPMVVSRIPNVQFVMRGDGPLLSTVQEEADRLKLGNSFKLISGFLNRGSLVQLYQASDVFVLTSPFEMLGGVILEAAATGVPIVCPKSGGPSEILGAYGSYFKAGSYEELAERIQIILRNPQTDVGKKLRALVMKDYQLKDFAKQYVRVYEDAMNSKR